jgi:hypothetical protein
VCLGRDVQLTCLLLELIRDGLSYRPPNPTTIANRAAQVATFADRAQTLGDSGDVEDTGDIEVLGKALIGISGAGKTRTLKRILRLFKQVIEFDVEKNLLLPVKMVTYVRVECPSNRTTSALIESIFTAIEQALGEKLPNAIRQGNKSILLSHIGQLCLDLSLGVLIVDEIQHILRSDNTRDRQLLNFFVELTNTLQVPVLFVGTPLAQRVIGGELRQARRMLGPAWSNLKRNEPPWEKFIETLWAYQFTGNVASLDSVKDKFYELTQGVPALAIALFRCAQTYVILMEETIPGAVINDEILQAAYDDYFQNVDPMVKALADGTPGRIAAYEDLDFDSEAMEAALLDNMANYREKLRIKLLLAITNANKKAIKIVKAKSALEAAKLAETPVIPTTGNVALLNAFKKAIEDGEDPGKAVADAAP